VLWCTCLSISRSSFTYLSFIIALSKGMCVRVYSFLVHPNQGEWVCGVARSRTTKNDVMLSVHAQTITFAIARNKLPTLSHDE
jgi:hypothetical protein